MTPRLTMLKPNIATIDTRRGAPVAVERIRGGRLRKIRERIILIRNSTRPEKNEIVLDPFMGSGTTLMACEQTGRVAFGMELDPVYCDVIVLRWEQFTGKKAVRP